ncbi:MAG: ADP-ribosylation factor-like protein, partial [Nitrospirota bacterium]
MALVNYATREINAKVVYYGPGLSGKTTNIQYVFLKVKPNNKGKLISLATQGDRTLFFDFLPVEFGQIKGFRTRFHLYTVPGQVFYNSTRKLVLKGADGVIFVADSQKLMMGENIQSLENLKTNLADMGIDHASFPIVIQYNKRDLPNAAPVDEMEEYLNPLGYPYFE